MKIQIPAEIKTLDYFFPPILAFADRVRTLVPIASQTKLAQTPQLSKNINSMNH